MTSEQIEWVLTLDPAVRDHYLQQVRRAHRPAYVKWGQDMGAPHWMTVLQALCVKLNECYSRSERMGFTYDLNLQTLADMWIAQKGRCVLTDQIMTFESGTVSLRNPLRMSVDRIDSTKGYTKPNVRLLTHWANNTLSTWDDALFAQMIRSAHQKLS